MIVCDIKMQVTNIARQTCVTRDNVTVDVESVLYWHVIDPFTATFQVDRLNVAIMERTMTTLRQVIGSHELQDTIINRESIGQEMECIISPAAYN